MCKAMMSVNPYGVPSRPFLPYFRVLKIDRDNNREQILSWHKQSMDGLFAWVLFDLSLIIII